MSKSIVILTEKRVTSKKDRRTLFYYIAYNNMDIYCFEGLKMAYRVMIDAGHGGFDNGATYNGRREKDDTLRLALAVGEILARNGIDVSYTRTTDVYQNPNEKAAIANNSGVDFFVSLHRNSSPYPNTYSGVQTLVYNLGDIKEDFANNINEELEKVGFNNLGVSVRTNLAVLRRTNMPSVLVEAGFINTDADNQLFDSKFDEIANAIAQGILKTIREDIEAPKDYRIQVGLFRNFNNSLNLQNRLIEDGYTTDIVRAGEFYAVLVGHFSDLQRARAIENILQQKGYDTLVIEA